MFLHFLWQLRKRKHYSLWTEVLQFIWWVTIGLTPEEQEHFRKSTEEATEDVYDLDMFVHVQLLKNHPPYFRWEQCVTDTVMRCEWRPGQPSYLIKNGKNIECKTDNHFPLVVPGVQATEHQAKALGDRKPTRDVRKQNYQNGFKHSRKILDLQVWQMYLQWTWPYHLQQFFFPRILHQNLLQTKQEAIYSLISQKTRIATYADARRWRGRHAK